MNLRKHLLVMGFLITPLFLMAQDLNENRFGKGLINFVAEDSSYSAKFAVRFQSLYTSSWDRPQGMGYQDGESNFLIRRSRLKFGGFAYTPKLTYKIEIGLSNRDISGASEFTHNAPRYLLDAVLKWNFYENFELWAGQTKLPGNRERVISSANLETVDRSLLNSRYNVDREMGVQLHHSFLLGERFLVREALAFSQGEGRNVTTGNIGGYHYTARAEVFPFGDFAAYTGADLAREETPKLAFGVSYDHNSNAVKTRSNMGSYMRNNTGFHETDISTFFVDAMFKYQGVSVMAEYANRSADDPVARHADGTPTGAIVNVGDAYNFQTGYVFGRDYQVVGRYTYIDLDEQFFGTNESQYTLGLSKYFVGHKLKIQTDISYTDFNLNQTDGLLYRLQFDIHF